MSANQSFTTVTETQRVPIWMQHSPAPVILDSVEMVSLVTAQV